MFMSPHIQRTSAMNSINLRNAIQKFEQRDIESAEKLLVDIIHDSPDDPNALHILGCIHYERGDLEKAIDLIQSSIHADNTNPLTFLNLAKIFFLRQEYSLTLVYIEKSLIINSQIAESWFCFGNALKMLCQFDKAIIAYQNALQLDSAHYGARFNLASLLIQVKEFTKAEKILSSLLVSYPDDTDIRLNYGKLCFDKGDYSKAVEHYKIAIKTSPDSPSLICNYVDSLLKLGQIDKARELLSGFFKAYDANHKLLIDCADATIVFDWHFCKSKTLWFETELFLCRDSLIPYLAVQNAKSCTYSFPFLINDRIMDCAENQISANGYLSKDKLIAPILCQELLDKFSGQGSCGVELLKFLSQNNVFNSILKFVSDMSGYPHLIWSCLLNSKGSSCNSPSDIWHYDNHYSEYTSKIIVYLNSQIQVLSATQFVKQASSKELSEKSGYMGLMSQRSNYQSLVSAFAAELELNPSTLDPDFFTFSPREAGAGIWFYPSRVLHRGVKPKEGMRYTLTFSLTRLPFDDCWTTKSCSDKSFEILMDKVNSMEVECDAIPFWTLR